MTIKNDAKFGAELNCRFKIWHQKFDEFRPKYSKVSKIYILMGSF